MNKLLFGINPFFFLLFLSSFVNAQTATLTGPLGTGRVLHRSHVLSNGNVLVFGGDNDNFSTSEIYSSAELYDPIAKTWSYTGSMHSPRTAFTSVLLNNGKVLAIGGMNLTTRQTSCELYDPSTGNWEMTDSIETGSMFHASVKLSDGRVLVAGESNVKTTELYDPETGKWKTVGAMNLFHGEGMAMILLDNGKVLATGGRQTPTRAELYDPISEQWTLLNNSMVSSHSYHSMLRLKTGKFLIAGTLTSLDAQDMASCELYDATASSFTSTGKMVSFVARVPMTLLDDGRVLSYHSGDLTTPLDSKCIQLYDPITGVWSAATYNFFGGNAATVNLLNDGKVLLTGGSVATGNGGITKCYLVSQDIYTSCTPPNVDLIVTGGVGCKGLSTKVDLPVSENGVTYELYVSGRSAGTPTTSSGAGFYLYAFQNLVANGTNVINVRVTKPGCPAFFLKDTAVVTVKLAALARPVITAGGPTTFCSGGNVILSAPLGMPGYFWTTGSGLQKITVTASGFYRAMLKDGAGCYTDYSDPIQVTVAPSTLSAGANQTVCANTPAFALTGMSATGGTWTGTGVSSNGVFDPSISGTGNFTLTYSMCAKTATKIVTVAVIPVVPNFTPKAPSDSVCVYGPTTIRINDAAYNVKYEFWYNGTLMGTVARTTTTGVQISTVSIGKKTTYTIKGIMTNACGSDTLIKTYSIYPYVDPTLTVGTKTPHLCRKETGYIYVIGSNPKVNYQLKRGSKSIGTPVRGNGDTLYLSTGVLQESGLYTVIGTHTSAGCVATLLQNVRINVTGPHAYFTLNTYNVELGDAISIMNRSDNPGGTYSWSFASGSQLTNSMDQNPDDLLYTTTGNQKLKLICTAPDGCLDSIIRKVNIINPPIASACDYSVSSGRSLNSVAIAVDNEDNYFQLLCDSETKGYEYSPHGDSLNFNLENTTYNSITTLIKYNKKGVIQWANSLRSVAHVGNGQVITDSLGNIYCAYYTASQLNTDSSRAYSTDGSYNQFYSGDDPTGNTVFTSVIISKYDKDGINLWNATYLDAMSALHFIPLALDKDLNVFLSGSYFTVKYNKNGVQQWKKHKGHAALKVDSKGNLWGVMGDSLVIDKYDTNGTLIFTKSKPAHLLSSTQINPMYLELDEKDNLYISGRYFGSFVLNKDTLTNPNLSTPGDMDLFLCKMNPFGQYEWSKQIRSTASVIYQKGMDYKEGQLVFAAMTYQNKLRYNKSGAKYIDSLEFLNTGNFVGITDTTSAGLIRLAPTYDVNSSGYTTACNLISFANHSDKILYSDPNAKYSPFGISIALNPLVPSLLASKVSVIMALKPECVFQQSVPVSSYTVAQSNCINTNIQFFDASSAGANAWNWTFEGGTPASSTKANPLVSFATTGTHTITVTASNTIGSGNTYTNSIQIGEPPIVTVTPDVACTGSDVVLTATGAASYLWNNATTGSTLTLYGVNNGIEVTLQAASIEGCTTIVYHTLQAEVCTGTLGENNQVVQVYPNPCIDFFNIKAQDLKGNKDITLYNMEGKIVWQQLNVLSNQLSAVNTNALAPGIYHLIVTTEQSIIMEQNISVIRH